MKADPLHQTVVDVRCPGDVAETDVGDSSFGNQGNRRFDDGLDDGIFSVRLV